MNSLTLSFVVVAALLTPALRSEPAGAIRTISFDDQRAGDPPRGFSCALTGQGRPGVWQVARDETAASRSNVLAQTDPDATSYRFPVCVLDAVSATDVPDPPPAR